MKEIELEGIVIAKLFNGEYIIGEVDNAAQTDTAFLQSLFVTLKNPRQIVMMPTMGGQLGMAMKPVCFPFTSKRLKDELQLPKAQVMFYLHDSLGEIEKDIINGYKAEVTGIKVASAEDTAALVV